MKTALLFPRAVHTTLEKVWILFGFPAESLLLLRSVVDKTERLWIHRGPANAVSYLKESNRVLMKALGGEPVTASAGPHCLGIDRKGLPKLIPHPLRVAITHGHLDWIRWGLLAVSIYRVLLVPGVPKLQTITDPCPVNIGQFWVDSGAEEFLPQFLTTLRSFGAGTDEGGLYGRNVLAKLTLGMLEWQQCHSTNKSGPNGPALLTAHVDALFLRGSKIWEHFRTYALLVSSPAILEQLETLADRAARLYNITRLAQEGYGLGKLSEKQEAAGKVRVFAIPDYWTQSLFRPLHKALFSVLRGIPTDCTFDQIGGVDRAANAGCHHYWSFDLSAATDRFPLEIQKLILKKAIGGNPSYVTRLVDCWAALLVERGYVHNGAEKFGPVYYKAGQPMGAYSSWAAFAFSHHFMVQLAAYKVLGPALAADYRGWWSNYELLGDDVVFWGDDLTSASVAEMYERLMQDVGCQINRDKSLVSANGTFEFAKKVVQNGQLLTLFHWKEWEAAFGDVASETAKQLKDELSCLNPLNPSERGLYFRMKDRLAELSARQRNVYRYADFVNILVKRGSEGVTLDSALRAWLSTNQWNAVTRVAALNSLEDKRVRDLILILTSPVGAFPLPPSLWIAIWALPYVTVSAWAGVNAGYAVLEAREQESLLTIRKALEQIQQAARTALLAASREAVDGWKEILNHAIGDFALGAPLHPGRDRTMPNSRDLSVAAHVMFTWNDLRDGTPVLRALWDMFSVHPWMSVVRRISPELFEAGLDHIYAPLVEGGMQDANWWLGEDLPESWMRTMSDAPKRANAWMTCPLEDLLTLPVQEVLPLAYPTRGNWKELKAATRGAFVTKAHRLVHQNDKKGGQKVKLSFSLLRREGNSILRA